jgi:diguanylate cyclase (GGDEF)-like protein
LHYNINVGKFTGEKRMKLLQTTFNNNFVQTIDEWNLKDKTAIFHVFVPFDIQDNIRKTDEVRQALASLYPDIPVIGCTATGEIYNGTMCDSEIVVSATVFENPNSRVEVFPYYAQKNNVDTEELLKIAQNTSNLKGIELITAAPYQPLEAARVIMDKLPDDIEIFGAVAVGDQFQKAFIFANDCEYSYDSSACIMYIGDDLHIRTERMLGWKAIGYPLKVTKSDGTVVYELDGKPAYDVYNHYLQIHKDKNFFYDALQFPWEVKVDDDDTVYIRHAKSVNPDGSIVMSTNIPQGAEIRITFGDPRRIINHTKQTSTEIKKFSPEVVYVINCMGRKLFWDLKEDIEVSEISKNLQTTGFSALGELLRYNGTTVLNNLSIVCVAMREGPILNMISQDTLDYEYQDSGSNLSVTHRLAIFINTITEELMDKNKQLNEMLYKANHDALTGLLNRGAIERIIYDGISNDSTSYMDNCHLIMLDIDDFKMLNDTYGHNEGDNALRGLAECLKKEIDSMNNAEVGRWGGEEFMIFLGNCTNQEAVGIANNIRANVKTLRFKNGNISVSIGVTNHKAGESVLGTIDRVDRLLYNAKNNGKDRVCFEFVES